jgi:hypothetical protein
LLSLFFTNHKVQDKIPNVRMEEHSTIGRGPHQVSAPPHQGWSRIFAALRKATAAAPRMRRARVVLAGAIDPTSRIVHFACPEKLNREDNKDLKEDISRSLRSSWFGFLWFAFQAWSMTAAKAQKAGLREPLDPSIVWIL